MPVPSPNQQRTIEIVTGAAFTVIAAAIGASIDGLAGMFVGAIIGLVSVVVFWLQWASIEHTRTGHSKPIHAIALGAGLLVLIVMGEIAGLIEFMRTAGSPARDLTFLTRTLDDSALTEAIDGYQDFGEAAGRTRDARSVVWLFVWLDSLLFIWAYGIVFGRVVQRRLEKGGVDGAPATGDTRRLIQIAGIALFVLVVTDWLENLSLAALVEEVWRHDSTRALTWVLMVVSTAMFWVKWISVAVGAATLITARVISGTPFLGRGSGTLREATKRLRPLVVISVVLVVVLFQPLQVSDMMLRLGDLGWPLVWTLIAIALLAVTLWVWARYLQASPPEMRQSLSDQSLLLVGGAMVVVGVVLVVALDWHWVVIVPGAMAAAVGLGGRAFSKPEEASGEEMTDAEQERVAGATYLPALLSGGATVLVGTAMIRAGAADAYFLETASAARRLVLVGAAVVIVGACLPWLLRWLFARARIDALVSRFVDPQGARLAQVALVINISCAVAALIALVIQPVHTAQSMGALALLLAFLGLAASVSGSLVRWADRFRPPTMFDRLKIRRIPLFSALALWFVIGQFAFDHSNHDVRSEIPLVEAATPEGCDKAPPVSPTIEETWAWWTKTNGIDNIDSEVSGERTAYPLVMVAASGGGVRAAWWTAAVMGELVPEAGAGCVDTPPSTFAGRQIFAASGISGGSLGLATHQAAVRGGVEIDGDAAWVDARLGTDHLSPAFAWLTYVEFPRSMLGFRYGMDRAEVMERSWEDPWDGDELELGLRAGWSAAPQLPMLALNGATVSDGCRALATVLDVDSDAGDCRSTESQPILHETYATNEFICPTGDLRLSTSALLSARFPLISPAGRLETCGGEHTIEIVDGGYRDANGAETVVDLLHRIDPLIADYNDDPASPHCVVPVYLFIEDDFRLAEPPVAGGLWPPLLAPAEAILAARGSGSGEADAQIRSMLAEDDRLRIGPTAAPGAHPALGWSLSTTTRTKMIEQLANHEEIKRLQTRVEEIREMSCTGALAAPDPDQP